MRTGLERPPSRRTSQLLQAGLRAPAPVIYLHTRVVPGSSKVRYNLAQARAQIPPGSRTVKEASETFERNSRTLPLEAFREQFASQCEQYGRQAVASLRSPRAASTGPQPPPDSAPRHP